jgi:hypothetical protein
MDKEASALDELFATMGADMGKAALVPFEMVMHGVLVALRSAAARADIFSLSILDVFIRHPMPVGTGWLAFKF